jgi:hypothetical protein
MSEQNFTYGGITFSVSWGMLFQRAFWEFIEKNDGELLGSDLLAAVVYEGNKAWAKLEGKPKEFKGIADVYQLIEKGDADNELLIIEAFRETQFYKAMTTLAETVTDSEKKNMTGTISEDMPLVNAY